LIASTYAYHLYFLFQRFARLHFCTLGDNAVLRFFVVVVFFFVKEMVHFEIKFWYVLAYLKGCRRLFSRSSFNFDIFRSNRSCLSVI